MRPAEAPASRRRALANFLAANGCARAEPKRLAGDASFRTYHRVESEDRRLVLMDAPPPEEDIRPFVVVAELLRNYGLSAPEILAEDRENGFLLIEDFGDDTYTRLLTGGADEEALYGLAIDTLAALHRAAAARTLPDLPPYDERRLLDEAALLTDWYMPAIHERPIPPAARDAYLAAWSQVLPGAALPRPTLVLRDYHVDNLMLLRDRDGVRRCGLLDFQDAVIGPPSYDLISLLEDVRRDVPAALRDAMTERYLAAFPQLDRDAFGRSAAILAAQRNSKIIGIFTRLCRRDGKPGYLQHLPRVWRLLEQDLRHPALAAVAEWFDRYLPPSSRLIPEAITTR